MPNDRQTHGEHRSECKDEDEDGEADADDLGGRWLGLSEDHAAELGTEPVDLRQLLLDCVAHLCGVADVDALPQLDARVRDPSRLAAAGGDLARPFLRVGTHDADDVVEPFDLGEERLHGRTNLLVADTLLGLEHDRARVARALPTEAVFEHVDAGGRFDIGKVRVVAVGRPHGTREGAGDHERGEPEADHEPLPAMGPATKTRKHRATSGGWTVHILLSRRRLRHSKMGGPNNKSAQRRRSPDRTG
jgi:hypothetical protein